MTTLDEGHKIASRARLTSRSTDPTVPPSIRYEVALAKRGTLPPPPKPLDSLTAAARRLTTQQLSASRTKRAAPSQAWQEDSWEMYDLVGEQRFLAGTIAAQMSQAKLYVGELDPMTEGDRPIPTENPGVAAALNQFGESATVRAQMIERAGINLFVAGDCWTVGVPKHLVPDSPEFIARRDAAASGLVPATPPTMAVTDMAWFVFSLQEVKITNDKATLTMPSGDHVEAPLNDLYLVRCWRSHARMAWEADSPTRACLPVLRQIVGLTMHSSAQVDSRLAGAGLLIMPQSASQKPAVIPEANLDPSDPGYYDEEGPTDNDTDSVTEALMEAMITPINDRGVASAVVPLVLTVPDEACDKVRWVSFREQLDATANVQMDNAIRRLALGQDAPPELLLGTSSMNHWGAWLVQEGTVRTHIEPPLALICDAWTTQYLWPVLEEMRVPDFKKYVIWYDVESLIARPNRTADAKDLYNAGVISDNALLRESGFDADDKPAAEERPLLDPAVEMALDLARANPSLFVAPGLDAVIAQLRSALDNGAGSAPVPPATVTPPVSTTTTTTAPSGGVPLPATRPAQPNPAPVG